MAKEYFGSSNEMTKMVQMYILRDLFKTNEEKEADTLKLESLRKSAGGSYSEIERRLDAYSSTENLTTPEGIEKVYTKINTALMAGKFGNNVGVTDFVKNYMGALTQSSILKSEIATNRKKLQTLTNPSSINKLLIEAQVADDTTASVAMIENHIVDLSVVRNKLADIPGARSKLSPYLDTRFNNALTKFDTALQDLTQGKFTKKDLSRIMNGTYATMVLADAGIEAKIKELEITNKYKQPALQEKQYMKILQDIESAVTGYDDKLNLEVQRFDFLNMSESLVPSGGGPTPEMDKARDDLALLSGFRQERLIGQYSQQYKDAYDNLKKLRKKHPNKMVYVGFEEIMNKKIHNELYNYIPPDFYDGNGNGGYVPKHPSKSEELNVIKNMLKNRTITFTKDIFDSSNKVWKQEGESINGLGNPGAASWKISKDGIKRDANNNLISLNIDIPTADWPSSYNLRPEVYMRGSVSLSPEDFVIEDSPYKTGVGYKRPKYGITSYNIYNNLYELVQK